MFLKNSDEKKQLEQLFFFSAIWYYEAPRAPHHNSQKWQVLFFQSANFNNTLMCLPLFIRTSSSQFFSDRTRCHLLKSVKNDVEAWLWSQFDLRMLSLKMKVIEVFQVICYVFDLYFHCITLITIGLFHTSFHSWFVVKVLHTFFHYRFAVGFFYIF